MTRHRIIFTGVTLLAMTGSLWAQTKSTTEKKKGSVHVESTRMTGVVDWIEGNTLVARMRPNGDYRVFIVPPDRQFEIDGQIKHIGDIKRGSSVWIKEKRSHYSNFHWQDGYGAFSVGYTQLNAVKKYIANQKQHHSRKTFEDEFRYFLKKYEVEYDERYVWS